MEMGRQDPQKLSSGTDILMLNQHLKMLFVSFWSLSHFTLFVVTLNVL